MTGGEVSLHTGPCGVERAEDVHRLTQLAFEPQRELDPPSGAVAESLERVVDDLAAGGGAVAAVDGRAVGCLRWEVAEDGRFHVRRVAVDPDCQRQGIGRALMTWAESEARRRGCDRVSVGVRIALPGNLALYQSLGYAVVTEHRHDGYDQPTWLELHKPVR